MSKRSDDSHHGNSCFSSLTIKGAQSNWHKNRAVCRHLQLDEIHPICSVPKCLVKTFCKRLSHICLIKKRSYRQRELSSGSPCVASMLSLEKSGDAVDRPVSPCFGRPGRVTGSAGKGQRLNGDSNTNPLLQKGMEKNLHASEFAN